MRLDHGLDRGSSSQLAFDDAEHAALLSRDEDSACILRIVSAVPLVDIGALDLAPGEFLGLSMTSRRVCPSYGLPGSAFGMQHELTARGAGAGGDDGDLDAELVGRAGLSLADALGLGGMEGIELPATLTLLLALDPTGARHPEGKCRPRCPDGRRSCGLMSRISRPSLLRRIRQLPAVTVELLGHGA